MPRIRRRARLWLVWLLIAFGALNLIGPPIEAWRRPGDDWATARARQTPIERFLTTLRDDDDVQRYYAYAEAALGRPYVADYVRPADGEELEGQPDLSRTVAPNRPLVPWRDFSVEYPPAMMAVALLPALVARDAETYVRLFAIEMQAALTLAVWLAARTADRLKANAGEDTLAEAIRLTLALGVIAVRRYDPAVALALAAAVYALTARRPALSGAALGLAVALKGVPLALAPIFALYAFRAPQHALARWLLGLAVALGAPALAYVGLAGPHALDAFAYHARRPVQIETIYSGLLILARSLEPGLLSEAHTFGSMNMVSWAEPALRALSTGATLAGVAASWAFAWMRMRRAQDERERLLVVIRASLIGLIAWITLGKVFSPQYCVWLVPVAAAAAPITRPAARTAIFAAFLMVQAEYPFLYGFFYSTLTPLAGVLIILRTACLWRYAGRAIEAPAARKAFALDRA